MRKLLYIGVCSLFLSNAPAGTIYGTVKAKGLVDAPPPDGGGAYASRKLKDVETIDYDSIHDFIVYIDGPIAGSKPPTEVSVIKQKGAEFIPHVQPIMAGTKVEFPNEDEIFHNVFSKSQIHPFNLGLYKKGDAAKTVLFDQPGEVDVFCSIHSRMSCVILVLENPYFAATKSNGHYEITNVPAGTYKLVGWQERLFSRTNTVTVPATGEVKVNFELGPDAK